MNRCNTPHEWRFIVFATTQGAQWVEPSELVNLPIHRSGPAKPAVREALPAFPAWGPAFVEGSVELGVVVRRH
jgi:hypothetical protein